MKFANLVLIYKKEILDILRDRRTLLSMIVAPLVTIPLVYLVMGLVMTKSMEDLESRTYTVGVINGNYSPALVQKLQMLAPNTTVQDFNPAQEDAAHMLLADGALQVLLILPERPVGILESTSDRLKLYVNKSDDQALIARERVEDALELIRQEMSKQKLDAIGAPQTILEPFQWSIINTASDKEMSGRLLGILMPYMIILLTLTGGMYAAMDLTAGEKERSTLETLLVSPASRLEIVLGKFFTIMTVSLITVVIAIFSLTISLAYGMDMLISSEIPEGITFSLDMTSILLILLLMIPLTAFLSSLLMTISIYAKSMREAQSYLSPLMMLIFIPAMMSMAPGKEMSAQEAWIPVLNVSLAMKNIIESNPDMTMILNTLLSSTVWAAVGIMLTVRTFKKENVLFRT